MTQDMLNVLRAGFCSRCYFEGATACDECTTQAHNMMPSNFRLAKAEEPGKLDTWWRKIRIRREPAGNWCVEKRFIWWPRWVRHGLCSYPTRQRAVWAAERLVRGEYWGDH